jgi:hypothetical protein
MTTVKTTAEVIASNEFAMKHVLASAKILKSIIQNGSSQLNMEKLMDLSLSPDISDVDLISEWEQVSLNNDRISIIYIIACCVQVKEAFSNNENFTDACERFGKSCAYPGTK